MNTVEPEEGAKEQSLDRKILWLRFIAAETEEELDELYNSGDPMIQKAVRELRKMSEDEEIVELARKREEVLFGDGDGTNDED